MARLTPAGLRAQPDPDSRFPPPPAAAPPDPPLLSAIPGAPEPVPPVPPARPFSLPPSITPLPRGGWRLTLSPAAEAPDEAARPALAEIGRRLAMETEGRVALVSQVSRGEDASAARRRSLDRAVAAKAALVAGGLAETRVDVFPMGRLPGGLDALDILPPGAARPAP